MRRALGLGLICFSGALSLVALAGCNQDAARPAPSSSATTSSSLGPGSGSASPAPSGSAHVPSMPAVVANADWVAVARSPDAFDLQPLRGALFVDASGFLAQLGDGPLKQSPSVMRGLEKGQTGRVLGAYPDATWLVGSEGTFELTDGRWVSVPLLHEHETLLDLVATDGAGIVAAIALPANDMRLTSIASHTAAAHPPAPSRVLAIPDPHAPAPHARDEATTEDAPCKVRMKPKGVRLGAAPTGELFAAGYECEPLGHGAAIVERWAANEARSVVDALPGGEGGQVPRVAGVVARSANEALVYGSIGAPEEPYLARFDGKAWTREEATFGGAIETLAASDDGTLWAASSGQAHRRRPGGAWETVALPAGLVAHAVYPRTNDDVWVSARQSEGKARAVLLRTNRAGAASTTEIARLPPRNAMMGSIAAGRGFFATAACDRPFAHLMTAGPSRDAGGRALPIPKDFPELKGFLEGDFAGLTPVAYDDGAKLQVGVPAPTRDVARKLVSAFQERSSATAPPRDGAAGAPSEAFVACFEPPVVKR